MGIGEGKRKGVARFYEVLLVQELHRIFEEGLVRCDGLLPEFRPLWLKRRCRYRPPEKFAEHVKITFNPAQPVQEILGNPV